MDLPYLPAAVGTFAYEAKKYIHILRNHCIAFIGSLMLVGTRRVKPKQLPFDNKDQFLLVLDMPSGTSLERTDAAARE